MNLEYLETFLALARTKSFRAAAKQLKISQPTVSQHIKKLEATFNVKLIDRNPAGSHLTPEAQALLPYAQSLICTYDRAKMALKQKKCVIGASSNIGIYILPPYLKRYLEHFKNAFEIELVIDTNPTILAKLEFGEIDVAVMEWNPGLSEFIVQRWRSEELVIILPVDHPWGDLPLIPKALLHNVELLGGERGTGTGRILQEHWHEQAQTIQVSMQLGSTEAVKQAVQAGLGISIVLASSVTHAVQNGTLRAVSLDLDGIPLRKDLYVLWRKTFLPDSPAYQVAQGLLEDAKLH